MCFFLKKSASMSHDSMAVWRTDVTQRLGAEPGSMREWYRLSSTMIAPSAAMMMVQAYWLAVNSLCPPATKCLMSLPAQNTKPPVATILAIL